MSEAMVKLERARANLRAFVVNLCEIQADDPGVEVELPAGELEDLIAEIERCAAEVAIVGGAKAA